MDQQQIIAGLEARAKAAGVSISAVCSRAGIAASTFSRWKPSDRNPNPIGATLRSLDKLGIAMSQIERERRAELDRSINDHEVSPVEGADTATAGGDAGSNGDDLTPSEEPELAIGLLDEEPALPLEQAA